MLEIKNCVLDYYDPISFSHIFKNTNKSNLLDRRIKKTLSLFYFRFEMLFKNCSKHLEDEKKPYNICKKILATVVDPDQVAIYFEDSSSNTPYSKIQYFTRELKNFYSIFQSSGFPSINHLEMSEKKQHLRLTIELIKVVVTFNHSEDIKSRAQYALHSLSKLDGGTDCVNFDVASILSSTNKKVQKSAINRLSLFVVTPPHSIIAKFPMRVYKIDHTLNYTTKSSFSLDTSPLRSNQFHNDFWTITSLLVGEDKAEKWCLKNLKEIALLEKSFKISQIKNITKWLRDPFIILDNHDLLIPSNLNTSAGFDEIGLKQFYFATLIMCGQSSSNYLSNEFMGTCYTENQPNTMLSMGIKGIKKAPFYFEGGNLIPGVNEDGKKIYLCGGANILYSLLNSCTTFSTNEQKQALLQEMILLENTPLFCSKNILDVQKKLETIGVLHSFNDQEKLWISKLTISSEGSILKLMEEDLKHPIVLIGNIFEMQVHFHLDIFLLPAPGGVIFIQDNSLCLQVLNKISNNYQLSDIEKQKIAIYKKYAKKNQERHGEQLKTITEQLEASGFHVIPVPGNYYNLPSSLTPKVCFLNGIIGSGNDNYFCITNGSSYSNVDHYLQDAWTSILNGYGINNVYFTGKISKASIWDSSITPNNYFAADFNLNDGGGIHCRLQTVNKSLRGFEFTKKNNLTPKKTTNFECKTSYAQSLPLFYREMIEMQSLKKNS